MYIRPRTKQTFENEKKLNTYPDSYPVALCAGAALPFLFGHSTIDPEQQSVKSEVPYCVTSPSVPDKITFAGQEIDLTRYDHRERMDREQMSFTYMHSTTMLTIKRANRFFPIIEPILKENGVPDDFKYLAVIESNLNTLARSPAGAAGMWQFMQTTGREFGLEVNPNIDERYHVEKATRAACQYLKDAYQRYGNWLCVAAAYNGGQGRISSELKKQLVDQAVDLWLVEETSRYMFRLLAAKAVISNPQRYGFLLKREHLYPVIPYTLPDTHIQSTISDRYAETITCQSRFSMGGHVVISFTGMHIVGFPFFHQVVEDGFHVRLDIRICIFIDAKSGRGMLDEQM